MAEPPKSLSKMEVAEPKRLEQDVTLPLPNREIRRKYKKLKSKKHFRGVLAKQGHSVEEENMVDQKTQEELLKHLDVQKFLGVLNGLLTGQKKLVIETTKRGDGTGSMLHTFRVEDVDE